MRKSAVFAIYSVIFGLVLSQAVFSQTTAFNYQGSLKDGGNPANGNYDFEFLLFGAASGGSQIGSTVAVGNVVVTDGIFSVSLNFGDQFTGANRFLEIRVRPAGQSGFTILAPRQMVNSSPYSVKSLKAENATTADNALSLGGVAANQYVLTNDSRLSDARDPLPNSSNYINNTTSQQSSSNFNISGNGTAGGTISGDIVAATSFFTLNGQRILSGSTSNSLFVGLGTENNNNTGDSNTFVGTFAGNGNTTGKLNAFFGRSAGQNNTSGDDNSFFGFAAGFENTTGVENAFFGNDAGFNNTTGNNNSFFGSLAGARNRTSDNNSFFGFSAGFSNTTGDNNSFFGEGAGDSNTTGRFNSFFGRGAGDSNVTGGSNTFFGNAAGFSNSIGSFNTIIGSAANVGANNLTFATAIGSGSIVSTSNTIALGRSDGSDKVRVFGLGFAGSTSLCRNSNNEISTCSSSIRYKSNIRNFSSGLDLIKRLRPVSFNWTDGGMLDLGLVAEEVAEVEPLLTTTNDKGEVEGVKYDRVGVVLVNAVNEQQTQIESLEKKVGEQEELIERQQKLIEKQIGALKKQQTELDALKQLVCSNNPAAVICQPKEKK
ncbi:MAG: tail fiber domain-containing protein [Pyrinomonadaceae bacterium]